MLLPVHRKIKDDVWEQMHNDEFLASVDRELVKFPMLRPFVLLRNIIETELEEKHGYYQNAD